MQQHNIEFRFSDTQMLSVRFSYAPRTSSGAWESALAKALIQQGLLPNWEWADENTIEHTIPLAVRAKINIDFARELCYAAQHKITELLDEAIQLHVLLKAIRAGMIEGR